MAELIEVVRGHEAVSVGAGSQPVDRCPQHWTVDRRHRALVLRRRHRIRELVRQRISAVEVGTIQCQGTRRLRHRAALAQVLGPDRGLVGPRTVGGTLDARPEFLASHHRKLRVEAVMFVAPLRQLPMPLVPPSLQTCTIVVIYLVI